MSDRLRFLTCCLNDLNASQAGCTPRGCGSRAVAPRASALRAASLQTVQRNLAVQAALCEDLEHAETVETVEAGEREALRLRVLEATELYNVAVKAGRDDAALRVLRNTGFSDAETIKKHWGMLIDEVLRSESRRKWEKNTHRERERERRVQGWIEGSMDGSIDGSIDGWMDEVERNGLNE